MPNLPMTTARSRSGCLFLGWEISAKTINFSAWAPPYFYSPLPSLCVSKAQRHFTGFISRQLSPASSLCFPLTFTQLPHFHQLVVFALCHCNFWRDGDLAPLLLFGASKLLKSLECLQAEENPAPSLVWMFAVQLQKPRVCIMLIPWF